MIISLGKVNFIQRLYRKEYLENEAILLDIKGISKTLTSGERISIRI